MSIYIESGFQFDFTAAINSTIHDKPAPHDGNNIWRGVDFRVTETNRQIWIEVKNWNSQEIVQQNEQPQVRKNYQRRLQGNSADNLRDEIIDKFLGTTSYLAWSGMGLPSRVLYIIFLQPPSGRGNDPLLGPFRDRLRDKFKNIPNTTWGNKISYEVVDFARFQALFPNYPVTRV